MRYLKAAAIGAALGIAAAFVVIVDGALSPATPLAPPASSVVKVKTQQGHGSGVHIGGGYVLTAQHVVTDRERVTLMLDSGVAVGAEVLWANEASDVALLHTRNDAAMRTSPLRCSGDAMVGDVIKASGNPQGLEFISTWGHVSGPPREHGQWRSVMVVDMTVGPGMSGGPVYDTAGNVVGLTVGGMVMAIGMSPSMIAISYAVPASVVCHLMGRT